MVFFIQFSDRVYGPLGAKIIAKIAKAWSENQRCLYDGISWVIPQVRYYQLPSHVDSHLSGTHSHFILYRHLQLGQNPAKVEREGAVLLLLYLTNRFCWPG